MSPALRASLPGARSRRSPPTSPTPPARRLCRLTPGRRPSVPPSPRKAAKGDEADQGDDHPEQDAPEDCDDDSNDHEDAAEGYATHAEPPCSVLCPMYRRSRHRSAAVEGRPGAALVERRVVKLLLPRALLGRRRILPSVPWQNRAAHTALGDAVLSVLFSRDPQRSYRCHSQQHQNPSHGRSIMPDVLLRHRPRTISLRTAAFHAKRTGSPLMRSRD
jgi:hypothetical protein